MPGPTTNAERRVSAASTGNGDPSPAGSVAPGGDDALANLGENRWHARRTTNDAHKPLVAGHF